MVNCAVILCRSRSAKGNAKVRFFSFPYINSKIEESLHSLVLERQALWISRIAKADLTIGNTRKIHNSRVCEKHFVKGSPAALEDIENPDWAPSLNLGHDISKEEDEKSDKEIDQAKKTNENSMLDKVIISENHDLDLELELNQDAYLNPKAEIYQEFGPSDETEIKRVTETETNKECENTEEILSDSDHNDYDRLTYYIQGPTKLKNNACNVTHKKALAAAKTLLMYMENQNDIDIADLIAIRRCMRKIKENIKANEI